MRKFAMLAVGTAFAAGVVLVPVSAASAAATPTAGAPVTQVHPRVSIFGCISSGGQVHEIAPGYGLCIGGYDDGQPVWW
ncbi:hypothetical protein ABH935_007837 [Catenulispora sp. GAS73]|uniref:hypothetical protein n=1 Tax=Catenulispora sp. GAS73 TaxID=3156269 RepID=UPI003516BF17